MPATNPRISVTVTPAIDEVLTRLCVATNQSKSAFVAELLESSMPVFERMATVIEAAAHAKDTLRAQTKKDMEEAETRLHEILGMTMDIFDETTAPIVKEAERVQRRARGPRSGAGRPAASPALQGEDGAATPAQPPYVTRGSGTPKQAKGAEANGQRKGEERSGSLKKIPAKGSNRAVAASKRKVKG